MNSHRLEIKKKHISKLLSATHSDMAKELKQRYAPKKTETKAAAEPQVDEDPLKGLDEVTLKKLLGE